MKKQIQITNLRLVLFAFSYLCRVKLVLKIFFLLQITANYLAKQNNKDYYDNLIKIRREKKSNSYHLILTYDQIKYTLAL